MFGISYGGISQLFAAQLRPPALEAIAPLSVVDATATTLYPGGVLNTGFAVAWAEERQFDAEPAGPANGEHWAYEQIQKGDETCAANQDTARRGDEPAVRRSKKTRPTTRPWPTRWTRSRSSTTSTCRRSWRASGRTSRPAGTAPIWPSTSPARSSKWFTFTNGAHIDSLDPVHVQPAVRLPGAVRRAPGADRQLGGHRRVPRSESSTTAAMGLPKGDDVTLPADPIQEQPTYAAALAAFEALPQIRVLFDNGAGASPTGHNDGRQPLSRASNSPSPRSRSPARRLSSWYLGPERHAQRSSRPRRKGPTPTPRTRAPRR